MFSEIEPAMTVRDVAKFLSVDEKTIYRLEWLSYLWHSIQHTINVDIVWLQMASHGTRIKTISLIYIKILVLIGSVRYQSIADSLSANLQFTSIFFYVMVRRLRQIQTVRHVVASRVLQ